MFVDLVTKMLKYDPAERIKPADALRHPFLGDTHGGAQQSQRKGKEQGEGEGEAGRRSR